MEIRIDFDKVAELSLEIFNSLPKTGKPKTDQWTVLSCIVKEENSTYEVVSLGTGSKCIGKNKMSKRGDILNDSHAEVICRKSFLLYLYEQMENVFRNEHSIFIYDETSSKFCLKDVKFHFFTTLMPCGDASIFPKNSQSNVDIGDVLNKDKLINSSERYSHSEGPECKKLRREDADIFRTGAKCLYTDEKQDPLKEGDGYHVIGVVRTKPGRGDPTLSVSCSDKMAKWCHLGIQGALMSIMLKEPIYLSSFIVASGTPFSEESLKRAIYDRFEKLKMQPPYKKGLLRFHQVKNSEFKFQKDGWKEACPSSISWYKDGNFSKQKPEVAVDGKRQGVTKKNRNSVVSRLKICKAGLFQKFLELSSYKNDKFGKLNYRQCKQEAVLYQSNWENMKSAFGVWPEKEMDLLEFSSE